MTKLLFAHHGSELDDSARQFLRSLRVTAKSYPTASITVALTHDGRLVRAARNIASDVRVESKGVSRARANLDAHDLVYLSGALRADYALASRQSQTPCLLHVHKAPTGFARGRLVALAALTRSLRVYDSPAIRKAYGAFAPGLVVREDTYATDIAAAIERALQSRKRSRVVFCGTRGVPASYGGFETAVDEISKAFVAGGADAEVICRSGSYSDEQLEHRGRRLTYVAGSPNRVLDTVVSSLQTGVYLLANRRDYRHAFWFNNANLPGILLTRLAGIPTTVNTDGLEWRRAKWPKPLKAYYFASSWLITRTCPSLVSDSRAIQAYYRKIFRGDTHFIPYGGPPSVRVPRERQDKILASYGLAPGRYFLQVTRLEPDNLPLEIARGFVQSGLRDQGYKLVIIGLKDASPYVARLCALGGGVSVMKAEYDQEVLWTLRRHCYAYAHGNSVGGTNPALLEAMSTCPRVLAIDNLFSREVLGPFGAYFRPASLADDFRRVLWLPDQSREMQERVETLYRWDAVSACYQSLVASSAPDYAALVSASGSEGAELRDTK